MGNHSGSLKPHPPPPPPPYLKGIRYLKNSKKGYSLKRGNADFFTVVNTKFKDFS